MDHDHKVTYEDFLLIGKSNVKQFSKDVKPLKNRIGNEELEQMHVFKDLGSFLSMDGLQLDAAEDSKELVDFLREKMVAIKKDVFGEFTDSKQKKQTVFVYTLQNSNGFVVQVMNYGATITSIKYPDGSGVVDDVTLGFSTFPEYLASNNPYFGAVVGRVANRIGGAKFNLNGQEYKVSANRPPFQLHGGFRGFDKVIWYSEVQGDKLVLTYLSEDGEEGFPGAVLATAIYSVTADNELKLELTANSTKPTPVNMVNHAYFNLAGHGAGEKGLYEHIISMNADRYTLTDSDSIPTGVLAPVGGTLWDLRIPRVLGDMIPLIPGGGYDQNLCNTISDTGLKFVARVVHPKTSRSLEVYSNQPGVQLYTSNFLPKKSDKGDDVVGRDGVKYYQHQAFCLETQNYPDAVNHSNFPDSILKPGDVYKHVVIYKFGLFGNDSDAISDKFMYQVTTKP